MLLYYVLTLYYNIVLTVHVHYNIENVIIMQNVLKQTKYNHCNGIMAKHYKRKCPKYWKI